jgi:hypothetical protein
MSRRCNFRSVPEFPADLISQSPNSREVKVAYLLASEIWVGIVCIQSCLILLTSVKGLWVLSFYGRKGELSNNDTPNKPKAFFLGDVVHLLQKYPNLIVVAELLPSRLLEFASDIMGIPAHRFIEQKETSLAVRSKLLFVPYLASCSTQSSGFGLSTRQVIQTVHPEWYHSQARDIVVLHRFERNECNRCLRNSNEIVDAVQKRFPNRVVHHLITGNMSMLKVGSILARTELFIAPHGAGKFFLIDFCDVLIFLSKQVWQI